VGGDLGGETVHASGYAAATRARRRPGGHASHIYAFKDERSACNDCWISNKLTKKKLAGGFCDENDCMVATPPRNGRRSSCWFQKLFSQPKVFSLKSSVSAIKLSCGYRPAFTTVLIVNVVSRPVLRLKKIGETAIKITPPGRRGSGLAHADSDMVYRTCLCAEMAPLNPFKNHLTAPGWLIALRTCADTEAK
jgi:hypothetical protein